MTQTKEVSRQKVIQTVVVINTLLIALIIIATKI